MFKKITILFFILFFVVSCWDDTDTSWTSSWLVETKTDSISIEIPSNWEVLEDVENILPSPNQWKIELAVNSKSIVNWFSNNLLILQDDLNKYTTSKEFSMLNNIWASWEYLEYSEIDSKEFKFLDEEVSELYVFEARYNTESPKLKFLQTAHICNQNKAFFLTLSIPTSTKDLSKYEYLLSTFKCK